MRSILSRQSGLGSMHCGFGTVVAVAKWPSCKRCPQDVVYRTSVICAMVAHFNSVSVSRKSLGLEMWWPFNLVSDSQPATPPPSISRSPPCAFSRSHAVKYDCMKANSNLQIFVRLFLKQHARSCFYFCVIFSYS